MYTSPGLVGVNGRPLKVLYTVCAPVVTGNPAISLQVQFAVIEDLPYSCIIEVDFLSQLKFWGMDNQQGYLKLNDSVMPVFSEPQFNGHINLVINRKILLAPGESTVIGTSPKNPGMDPFRPLSDRVLATEGLPDREQRTQVIIYPSLNLIGHRFSSNIPLTVTNTSNHRVTISKGTKIAFCTDDFIIHDHVSQQDILNVIDSINDPIDYMCSKERLAHLSDIEAQEVKSLLTEFKDKFSVSNDNIGRTSSHMFDII